jgi:hypothetical protein
VPKLLWCCSTIAVSFINRLQQATGGDSFNNLLPSAPDVDFVAPDRSAPMPSGKHHWLSRRWSSASPDRSYVVVIDTDPEARPGRWSLVGRCGPRSVGAREGQGGAQGLRPTGTKGAAVSISFGVSPIAWINDDMPELGGEIIIRPLMLSDRLALFEEFRSNPQRAPKSLLRFL